MRLITIDKATDLSALANVLYRDLTPETRQLVEAALLKANPGLAGRDAFQPGLVVNVPEIPVLGLKPTATGKDPAGDLLAVLKEAVAGYRAQLTDGFATALDEVDQQEKLLGQQDVVAAVGRDPSAAQLAKTLSTSFVERRSAIAEGKRTAEAAFEKIIKDLDSGLFPAP